MNDVRGKDIGFIFQDPVSSLNPTRRIGSQLTEAVLRHSDLSHTAAAARALELLDEVRLPRAAERLRAFPHELSGGMCQRVMIAVAIACSPRLILADEPTALDASIEAQVLDLLEELQRVHKMAIVFISHDVSVVARIANRVAVMYAGEFVEVAPTQEIFANPQHPYTEGLLASAPRLHDVRDARRTRLIALPGGSRRGWAVGAGLPLASRCASSSGRRVLHYPPELRELFPGHWARTVHPRQLRAKPAVRVLEGG